MAFTTRGIDTYRADSGGCFLSSSQTEMAKEKKGEGCPLCPRGCGLYGAGGIEIELGNGLFPFDYRGDRLGSVAEQAFRSKDGPFPLGDWIPCPFAPVPQQKSENIMGGTVPQQIIEQHFLFS